MPEKMNIDTRGAHAAALVSSHAAHTTTITLRKNTYVHNIVEQDHRGVKWVTRPMVGFQSGEAAPSTRTDMALMRMSKEGQRDGDEVAGLRAADQFYALASSSPPWRDQRTLIRLHTKICDRANFCRPQAKTPAPSFR